MSRHEEGRDEHMSFTCCRLSFLLPLFFIRDEVGEIERIRARGSRREVGDTRAREEEGGAQKRGRAARAPRIAIRLLFKRCLFCLLRVVVA